MRAPYNLQKMREAFAASKPVEETYSCERILNPGTWDDVVFPTSSGPRVKKPRKSEGHAQSRRGADGP